MAPQGRVLPEFPWKKVCIIDYEGNGILRQSGHPGQASFKRRCDTMYCMVVQDADTGEQWGFGQHQGPDWLERGWAKVCEFDLVLAHYGIGYDFPVIRELHPELKPREGMRFWDTMTMAKVVWPPDTLIGPDLALIKKGKLPAHMMKSHSVKAWGIRLGIHKIDYTGGFDEYSMEMYEYMLGDTPPVLKLWELIKERIGWTEGSKAPLVWPVLTMEYENEVARIIMQQELDGVDFDHDGAMALSCNLLNEKAKLDAALEETFGSWWQAEVDPEVGKVQSQTVNRKLPQFPDVTLPRYGKNGKALKPYVGPPLEETTEGSVFVPIHRVQYSASSRDHLGQRLQACFGWKPKAFGKDGKPTVDESTLEEIPESVLPKEIRETILNSFVVNKTYGTLAKGQRAWMRMADKEHIYGDRKMHGQMDTSGAVTRRGTHKNPNLSGTPSVRKEKVADGTEHVLFGLAGRYGPECRALYRADPGDEQTGVDASSLELILLGHYLFPFDQGVFSERVCDPTRDAHREHGDLCGFTRGDAKTAVYLKVYGGSAFKLSLGMPALPPEEIPEYLQYRGLRQLLNGVEKRMGEDFVRMMDDAERAKLAKARTIILKLEAGIEGLMPLIKSVQGAAERGWLKGMDGTKIHVRKPHAALNSLLQSAGAMACKIWMMLIDRKLASMGLVWGKDYRQILWVHDELQFTHKPGLGPLLKEVAEECMVEAGVMLGLRGKFRTEGKTGGNWFDCH